MNVARIILLSILALLSTPMTAAGPFPAEFDLSVLRPENGGDGSKGMLFLDQFTATTFMSSGSGDINNDGLDDILISAPRLLAPNNASFIGGAYTVLGMDMPFPATLAFPSLADDTISVPIDGFRIEGYVDTINGESVSAGGDVNGDGFDDMLIGGDFSTLPSALPGGTFVVFGKASPFDSQVMLQALLPSQGGDGSAGFLIDDDTMGDTVGSQVSMAGDVNGDGYDDILLGLARNDSGGSRSAAYLIYGSGSGFPPSLSLRELSPFLGGDGSVGTRINGSDQSYVTATRTAKAGDVNNDGIDDLLLGLPRQDGMFVGSGAIYVVFGRADGFGADFELSSLLPENGGDGSAGFVLLGTGSLEQAGWNVRGDGDVNGDGIADIIIGTNGSTGGAYVVFGRDTAFKPVMMLRTLSESFGGDGSQGFFANDAPGSRLRFGGVGFGDLNGDGVDDALFGAPFLNSSVGEDTGAIYVIYGNRAGFQPDMDLNLLRTVNGGNGDAGFVIEGSTAEEAVGGRFNVAGDANGDGADDVLIRSSVAGTLIRGQVLFGRLDIANNDEDADDVTDDVDNCTEIANPNQRDTDGDGFGNICDADFNNDCVVNALDLGFFRGTLFTDDPDADLNGDGEVDLFDLGYLRLHFFNPPGPSATASCDASLTLAKNSDPRR